MKNKFLGIIALVAVIGFGFVACDDDGGKKGKGAHVHDWEWVVTTDPTFIKEGEATETCKHDPSHTNRTRAVDPLPITTNEQWTTALSQISEEENIGEYTLNIRGDVNVAGSTANTFETTASGSSLSVTLKGDGKLYLTSQGNLLRLGARQTLIIDSEDLTLQGLKSGQNSANQNNNNSVVYVNTGGTLELQNGTVSGNTSTTIGGGVYVNGGTFTMQGGEISGNSTSGGNIYGGGVYLNGGTFTMEDGKISGNSASIGGGVYVNGGTFTMEDGEISSNTGSSNGGGVYVNSGTFTMEDGKISNNGASTAGGGVYVYSSNSTFTMKDGEISSNSARNDTGGGVCVNNRSTFTMQSGKIFGNTSGNGGGGVSVTDSATFTMQSGEISGNTTKLYGGGVYVYYNGTFTMGDGEIFGNTASDNGRGGGVYVNGGTFTMQRGEIFGNNATGSSNGGGVYVDSSNTSVFRIINGTIYGSNDDNLKNTATNGAALSGIAERGTLSGTTWTKAGDLSTTNNTIKVANGAIVP